MLQSNKATQNTDIPAKLIKANADIFAEFLMGKQTVQCIEQFVFPSKLRLANITPFHKRSTKSSKENYRPVSILSNISKVYVSSCLNKYLNILNLFYRNISVDSGKDTVSNIAYYQCYKNGNLLLIIKRCLVHF